MRGDGLMKAEKTEVRCYLWDYRSWSEGNPEKLEDVEETQPVHTVVLFQGDRWWASDLQIYGIINPPCS